MKASDYVVVKLGGEVIASPAIAAIAEDLAAMKRAGVDIVLVHGGGPQTTDLQKKLGQTPKIVAGRRITDEAALDVVTMVIAGKMNVAACAALLRAGAKPVGLHGASAHAIRAAKRPPRVVTGGGPDPIDFGQVGDVTGINRELIALLAGAGYIPVLACLGADTEGHVFNINADAVANRLAIALDARALVLVTDVSGILRDVSKPASRIASLTVAQGKQAIADGAITGGMIPKLEESFAALAAGVRAVHVVGQLQPGNLAAEVASPGTWGTLLTT